MSDPDPPPEAFGSARKFITSLSTSWCPIRRAEIERNLEENHHYSPLRAISIKETDHSRILGELLKPTGSHGKGDLFLKSFLRRIGISPVEGNWVVTVELDRIDILLRRSDPASVVIIENKACQATDQPGQLYRYWHRQIHRRHNGPNNGNPVPRERFRIIYLPPGDCTRPDERSVLRPSDLNDSTCNEARIPEDILDCRSFQTDVADWLNELLESEMGLSDRLRIFLKLYTEIWRLR